MESQHGVTTAAAGSMENGQVHESDDSGNVDQLRAQLQEQVLPVLAWLSLLFMCGLYAACDSVCVSV